MYKLVCGDKNNNKLSNAKGIELKYIDEVKNTANINSIEEIIFHENMSDLQFTYVVTALSIGKDLNPPIEYNIARVLFFAACTNYYIKNKDERIRNIITAMDLYEDYDNNYLALVTYETTKKEYVSIKWGEEMSLNSYIEFLVPISHFKSKQTGWVTISKTYPARLKVNNNDIFLIPNNLLSNLFTKVNGQVAARSSEELVNNFLHSESDKIAEILVFLGFKTILELTDEFLHQEDRFYFYQNNKLMFRYLDPSIFEDYNYDNNHEACWKEYANNCFVLYPKLDYILWGDFEEGKSKVLVYNNK